MRCDLFVIGIICINNTYLLQQVWSLDETYQRIWSEAYGKGNKVKQSKYAWSSTDGS